MLIQQRIRKLLRYDEKEGLLTWRIARGSQSAGSIAGSLYKNASGDLYCRVRVDGRSYSVARLIWFMVYGFWPEQIDHENRNSLDNRLSNLRDVSASGNAKNRRKRTDNPYGITGVYWQKSRRRWNSLIQSGGKIVYLYAGRDFFEACCRRRSAEIELGFHLEHGK